MLKIAQLSKLTENTIHKVTLNETSIILILSNGKVKAYESTCPHQGADLSTGHIENDSIVCPMHGRKFSCQDGSEKQFNSCLKKYEIVIDDDFVFLKNDENLKSSRDTTNSENLIEYNNLPSPPKKFLVGHLPDFNQEHKHLVIEDWAKKTGEVFKISLMGKKFIVSTNSEINTEILKNRPDKFTRYNKIGTVMKEMGIEGVFSVEGEQWKKHRKITAEALNAKNVKGFFPILSDMTERLYQRWEGIAKNGTTIDVQKEMTYYTVDLTTKIAFGYETKTMLKSGNVIQNQLEKIFPTINRRITAPLPTWRYIKSKEDKEFDYALDKVQNTVKEFIAQAQSNLSLNPEKKAEPSNFLEALLVEQEKEKTFSDKEIFGNVFTILLAGEDTTSNTISWTLYYLATHPEVFDKVRQEADRLLGNQALPTDYDIMQSLKYTEAVANEAIRIKPATPTLIMQALEDVQVKNLKIKKGMSVLMQNKVAQTSDQHFKDANQFIPERWQQDISGCPFHGQHTPDVVKSFGAGPRFCPGKNLAIQEIKMAVSMICKNFDIELAVQPEEVKEVFAFTMYPKNLMFKLKSRTEKMVALD